MEFCETDKRVIPSYKWRRVDYGTSAAREHITWRNPTSKNEEQSVGCCGLLLRCMWKSRQCKPTGDMLLPELLLFDNLGLSCFMFSGYCCQ